MDFEIAKKVVVTCFSIAVLRIEVACDPVVIQAFIRIKDLRFLELIHSIEVHMPTLLPYMQIHHSYTVHVGKMA